METADKIMLGISGAILAIIAILCGIFFGTGYGLKKPDKIYESQNGTSYLDINYLLYDIENPYQTKLKPNGKSYVRLRVGENEIDYDAYNSYYFSIYTPINFADTGYVDMDFASPGFDARVKGPFYMDLSFEGLLDNEPTGLEKGLEKKLKGMLNKEVAYLGTKKIDGRSYYSFTTLDSFRLEVYKVNKDGEKIYLREINSEDIVSSIKANKPLAIKNQNDLPFVESGRVYFDFSFQEIVSDSNSFGSFINRRTNSVYPNKDKEEIGILLPVRGILEKQNVQLNYVDEENESFIYRREVRLPLRDKMTFMLTTDLGTREAKLSISRYDISINEYVPIYESEKTGFTDYKMKLEIDSSSFKNGKYRFTVESLQDGAFLSESTYEYYLERKGE